MPYYCATVPTDFVCTLQTCCLERAPFLYIPNLGGNVFFAVYFAAFCIPQLWLGIRHRTVGFAIGMIAGLVLEVVGYVGRIMLHNDPFSPNGFLIYLICLTIAPVFISASIYLSIVRIINIYGVHLSWVKPKVIAAVFMTSDFCSLVLQAAGGGIADTSKGSAKQTGVNIMIAGLVLQVISLVVFLTYLALFAWRCSRHALDSDAAKVVFRRRGIFKVFLVSLITAAVAILIRSIFRVAELWDGFSGKIWQSEVDFMVLDGGMMGLAVLLLTIMHPGPIFGEHWHLAKGALKSEGSALKTKDWSESAYEGANLQPMQRTGLLAR